MVSDPQEDGLYWDMARNYFGSVIPMQKVSNALLGLSSIREDESSFAVLPWPEENEQNSWWHFLVHQEEAKQKIRIVCMLPYGITERTSASALSTRGVVISKIDFKESGDDHSFIAAELDPAISRARLFDALQEAGFEPLSITTRSGTESGATGI